MGNKSSSSSFGDKGGEWRRHSEDLRDVTLAAAASDHATGSRKPSLFEHGGGISSSSKTENASSSRNDGSGGGVGVLEKQSSSLSDIGKEAFNSGMELDSRRLRAAVEGTAGGRRFGGNQRAESSSSFTSSSSSSMLTSSSSSSSSLSGSGIPPNYYYSSRPAETLRRDVSRPYYVSRTTSDPRRELGVDDAIEVSHYRRRAPEDDDLDYSEEDEEDDDNEDVSSDEDDEWAKFGYFPPPKNDASMTTYMIPGSAGHEKRKQEGFLSRGNWTEEQDAALAAAVERFGSKNWRAIAEKVPGDRTHIQCLQRWNKVLKPGLVKGPWTEAEDARLAGAVEAETMGNWVAVAKHVPGRTAKQCRERWYLCLDPNIRRDPWTPAEDAKLVNLHAIHGNGWASIAKELPGRTENAVKSRFKSLERKRERAWTPREDAIILDARRARKHWTWLVEQGALPNRSKHAIKLRWKLVTEGFVDVATPSVQTSRATATTATTTTTTSPSLVSTSTFSPASLASTPSSAMKVQPTNDLGPSVTNTKPSLSKAGRPKSRIVPPGTVSSSSSSSSSSAATTSSVSQVVSGSTTMTTTTTTGEDKKGVSFDLEVPQNPEKRAKRKYTRRKKSGEPSPSGIRGGEEDDDDDAMIITPDINRNGNHHHSLVPGGGPDELTHDSHEIDVDAIMRALQNHSSSSSNTLGSSSSSSSSYYRSPAFAANNNNNSAAFNAAAAASLRRRKEFNTTRTPPRYPSAERMRASGAHNYSSLGSSTFGSDLNAGSEMLMVDPFETTVTSVSPSNFSGKHSFSSFGSHALFNNNASGGSFSTTSSYAPNQTHPSPQHYSHHHHHHHLPDIRRISSDKIMSIDPSSVSSSAPSSVVHHTSETNVSGDWLDVVTAPPAVKHLSKHGGSSGGNSSNGSSSHLVTGAPPTFSAAPELFGGDFDLNLSGVDMSDLAIV